MAPPQNDTFRFYSCKPQFFKVLFPDPFANLVIPRKFHMNLPRKLPKVATLFIPNGNFWHIEILRTGEDIYFEKGWSEFAKAHELRTGYFVVFRYEGNMIFKVKVFDTTCCLKNYSLTSHKRRYIEIKESSETQENTRDPKLLNGKPHEVAKREKMSTSQRTVEEMSVDSTISSRQFERILKPYTFSNSFYGIPKLFCVENGLQTKQTIFLKRGGSSEGKSWPVCFYLEATRGIFGKGWKEFREGAGLKEGDLCIFRLISKNSLVVDVMPQEREAYSMPIPECESTVRNYHLSHCFQSLSRKFCLRNKLTSTRDVTLKDLRGKEWHAKFYLHAKQGRLSRTGWTTFSSEYGLKVGDKCIFKLIAKDTLLVRVVKN